MKKNNVKLIGVFASVLLLVIVITASFAYFGSFNVNLTNNIAVNVNSVSPGNVIFVSNATQLNLQVPAANMSQIVANNEVEAASNTATLTVNLTGAANLLTTCTYDIVYEYDSTSNVYGTSPTTKNGDKEITLQVSNVNGTNNFASEKNFDSVSMASYYNNANKYYTLVSGASISSMGTLKSQNISITAKYYNLDIPQTSLEGSAFTGKIYVTNHKCETSEPDFFKILNKNGGKDAIEAKGTPDFTKVATTDEGMYATEDDLGISYYFRGKVNDNWVQFGEYTSNGPVRGFSSSGSLSYTVYNSLEECNAASSSNVDCEYIWKTGDKMYWRIIRINGDGSIRLIYSGTTAPTSETYYPAYYRTETTKTYFNDKKHSTSYVGYMYTLGEQHGNTTDSLAKIEVDNWYKTTSFMTTDKDLVADGIFCNDRMASTNSSGPYGELTDSNMTFQHYYTSYPNANSGISDLKCFNELDKFTVSSELGNGALTYPAALITAVEAKMAGSGQYTQFYLKTYGTFWTMSPYAYYSDGYGALECDVNERVIGNYLTSEKYGIRPVINISSFAKLSGNGTWNNVYTVS